MDMAKLAANTYVLMDDKRRDLVLLEAAADALRAASTELDPMKVADLIRNTREVYRIASGLIVKPETETMLTVAEAERRMERMLVKLIRAGQASGTIRISGDTRKASQLRSTTDFFDTTKQMSDAYALTDKVSEERFEEVLKQCREMGNLSRQHVAKMIRPHDPARVAAAVGLGPKTSRNRRPLPEVASTAGWELRKQVEIAERIFKDDRFRENRAQVVANLRSHIDYAVEVLTGLAAKLAENGK